MKIKHTLEAALPKKLARRAEIDTGNNRILEHAVLMVRADHQHWCARAA